MGQTIREVADYYQALFNHLSNEYDLILTITEMDEIIRLSLGVVEKINQKGKSQ